MNPIKSAILGIGLCVALLLTSAPSVEAQNQSTNLATGISDGPYNAFTNAGSAAVIQCNNHEEVAVTVGFALKSIPTNTPTMTFYFTLSDNPTNHPTTNWIALTAPANGTTMVYVPTNIYVGSFRYLVFKGFNNASTNSAATATNIIVRGQFKDYRFGLR